MTKEYIKKQQQGGYLSMNAIRKKLQLTTAKQDNITGPSKPIEERKALRNFITGQLVTGDQMNAPGTPMVDVQRQPDKLSVPQGKSIREKAMGALNYLDRDGKNEIGKIATEPLKASLRLLRPDKYFEDVHNDGDVGSALTNLALDGTQVVPATQELGAMGKVARGAIALGDSQFSRVGRALENIAMKGRVFGMSDEEIKALQLRDVGITANQRKGYMPIVSDVLQKRVHPFGYPESVKEVVDRVKGGNGLNAVEKDIARDPTMNQDGLFNTDLRRNDAWRTYLGIPQKNNTFRMADNFQSDFGSKIGEDRYSLNYDNSPKFITNMQFNRPDGSSFQAHYSSDPSQSIGGDLGVMGNFNIKQHPGGLEYWDRWDLDPELKTGLTKKVVDPETGNTFNDYRRIKIPVSKFLGKPFISNGLLSEDLLNGRIAPQIEGMESIASGSSRPTLAPTPKK